MIKVEELKISVDESYTGLRIDKFLVAALNMRFSRTFIRKLIDDQNVLVNEKFINAHYKVSQGESVEIRIPDPKSLELKPENIPILVVYEDRDVIVINKAAGISVHPSGSIITGTLVNALLYHCKNLSGVGGVLRPGIVHRLDKETSGLLIAAKHDKAHNALSDQFRNRTIKRVYIALVKGSVQLDNGRIELPIARRKKDITKMGVSFVDIKKKNAITNYKVMERLKGFTKLELVLETGRTHQIRVHLSHIGYPLIGDKLYGGPKGLDRHALHAKTLGFVHPTTKEPLEFDSELPDDMKGLIVRGHL
ncbi:MAG: RluA family pseudouridine synthase [Candidatus Omnitrophota bacterium]